MAQPHSSAGDAGFALLEAIVSAVVLAVVSLAVLSGISGATNSSVREKSRSVAAALAEQDQERMRAMSADQLGDYAPSTKSVLVDKVPYTVKSSTRWVSDDTGGTLSCTNSSASVDYLQVSTEVTSTIVGRNVKPVTVSSLVAPPVSRAKGTVAVQVVDRLNQPIKALTVQAVAATGGTFTEQTNDLGCAIFLNVPVGTYTVNLIQAGYIDAFGKNPGEKSVDVSNGTVQLITMRWDKGGNANWSVVTKNPFTAAQIASLPPQLTSGPSAGVSAVHGDEPTLQRPFTTSPATSLFPFTTPYSFFTGGCAQSNPALYDADYFATNVGAVQIGAGQVASPPSVQMYQPYLKLQLLNASSTPTNGMTVYATQKPTSDSDCTEMYRLTTITANGQAGMVTHYTGAATPPYDPGLPYGTYDICAQRISGSNKFWYLLPNVNLTAGAGMDAGAAKVNATNPDATLCPA